MTQSIPITSSAVLTQTNLADLSVKLPDGRLAATLDTAILFRELSKLQVPGIDVHDGKQLLLQKLGEYLEKITRPVWPTQGEVGP